MREVLEDFHESIRIDDQRITNLRYANDTIPLVCSSRKELMYLLGAVESASERRGLLLNTKKTKIMVIDDDRPYHGEDFKLDGGVIEKTTGFEFLGSVKR